VNDNAFILSVITVIAIAILIGKFIKAWRKPPDCYLKPV
jgi:hypothetical protein